MPCVRGCSPRILPPTSVSPSPSDRSRWCGALPSKRSGRPRGKKPSPVTIWRPDQLGKFLDVIVEHRLYAYFHLLAYRGLRRGEGLGTLWTDVELDGPHPTLTVRRQITSIKGELIEGPPKSDAGERAVPLDPGTVAALRAHRSQSNREHLSAGHRWTDTGRVFTDKLGSTLDPNRVGKVFVKLVEESRLPPVRLHDIRHCASSLVLASGGTLKDAQALLGHSSMSLTANTYSHLFPDHMAETAHRAAAVVPRRAQS